MPAHPIITDVARQAYLRAQQKVSESNALDSQRLVKLFKLQILEHFVYLHDRWIDEQEYEDWQTYIESMKERCRAYEWTFVRMTKHPFELTVERDRHEYVIRISSSNCTIKEVLHGSTTPTIR